MSLDFYLVNEWEGRLILAGCLKTQGRRDLKLFRVGRKGDLEVQLACYLVTEKAGLQLGHRMGDRRRNGAVERSVAGRLPNLFGEARH